MRDLSKKHFSDMANESGIVNFPLYPSISTELWMKVQSIDSRIVQMSFVEGALHLNAGWDVASSAIDTSGDKGMTFTSKLENWHSAGNKMPFLRSVCGGIIMQSTHLISMLKNKGFSSTQGGRPSPATVPV
jgi:hypothetical protein